MAGWTLCGVCCCCSWINIFSSPSVLAAYSCRVPLVVLQHSLLGNSHQPAATAATSACPLRAYHTPRSLCEHHQQGKGSKCGHALGRLEHETGALTTVTFPSIAEPPLACIGAKNAVRSQSARDNHQLGNEALWLSLSSTFLQANRGARQTAHAEM